MDTKHLKIFFFTLFLCFNGSTEEWTEHPVLVSYLKSDPVLSVSPLRGGESYDRLFKIRTVTGTWVIRVLNQKRSLEKRRLICEATQLIGEKALGPKVIWHDASYQFLVTEFVEGDLLTPEDIRDPILFQKLVLLVREAHNVLVQLTSSLKSYSLKDRVLQRLKEIASYVSDGRHLTDLRLAVEKVTIINPSYFSHGDIKGGNILKTQAGLLLIDWGEVGPSSFYDDLGSLSFHFSLDKDQEEVLLTLYFGCPPEERTFKTLRLHRWLAELHDRLWRMRKRQEEMRLHTRL